MKRTTALGLQRAENLFQTDWDEEGTVTVSLPADLGRRMLLERGWVITTFGDMRATRPYIGHLRALPDDAFYSATSPGGKRRCWHLEGAVALALAAEVL